jgi:hypothetical protein
MQHRQQQPKYSHILRREFPRKAFELRRAPERIRRDISSVSPFGRMTRIHCS